MLQKEFEKRKAANIRALELMPGKLALKVIDLVEALLEQNPTLPVVVQHVNSELPILSVQADAEHGVRLYV